MIVEQLYAPTAKDQLSGLAQRRWFSAIGSNSGTATSIIIDLEETPSDVVRFVQTICVTGTPGAAQRLQGCHATMQVVGATIISNFIWTWDPPNAPDAVFFSLQAGTPYVPIFPGERVRVTGIFSGSAASNLLGAVCCGVEIPRANLRR